MEMNKGKTENDKFIGIYHKQAVCENLDKLIALIKWRKDSRG